MHLAASLRQTESHASSGRRNGRQRDADVLQSLKYVAAAVYKRVEFPRRGIVYAAPVSEEARA
jgi:hypothetical protein